MRGLWLWEAGESLFSLLASALYADDHAQAESIKAEQKQSQACIQQQSVQQRHNHIQDILGGGVDCFLLGY